MAKLPRELVHQILNDLPIVKILQILASKIPHLEDCVFSHIHYQRLFKADNVSRVVDCFGLYREIRWFRKLAIADGISHTIPNDKRAQSSNTDIRI
jgi:hypothetical protein